MLSALAGLNFQRCALLSISLIYNLYNTQRRVGNTCKWLRAKRLRITRRKPLCIAQRPHLLAAAAAAAGVHRSCVQLGQHSVAHGLADEVDHILCKRMQGLKAACGLWILA